MIIVTIIINVFLYYQTLKLTWLHTEGTMIGV